MRGGKLVFCVSCFSFQRKAQWSRGENKINYYKGTTLGLKSPNKTISERTSKVRPLILLF